MARKFEIGDRVVAVLKYDDNEDIVGLTGEVLDYNTVGQVCVRYDEPFCQGHTLGGRCEDGYGWFTSESCLELYQEPAPPVEVLVSYDEVMA